MRLIAFSNGTVNVCIYIFMYVYVLVVCACQPECAKLFPLSDCFPAFHLIKALRDLVE